jgi:hypothetical protein
MNPFWGRESSGIWLPSLAGLLLWQQGKQPPGGTWSPAERGVWVPPPSRLLHSPFGFSAHRLPCFFSRCSYPEIRCPALDLPHSFPSSPRSPSPTPRHGHKPQLTGSESALLSNQPACPSPHYLPQPGEVATAFAASSTLCLSPSCPRFPVRGPG